MKIEKDFKQSPGKKLMSMNFFTQKIWKFIAQNYHIFFSASAFNQSKIREKIT